jgi:hypothetical protein
MARCKRRVSPTAEMARGPLSKLRHCGRGGPTDGSPKRHRLAVGQSDPDVPLCRSDNPRIALRPVIAAMHDQPDTVVVALDAGASRESPLWPLLDGQIMPPPRSPMARGCPVPARKIFCFCFPEACGTLSHPAQLRAAYRDRHERRCGMRWTRRCRVRMRSQGGATRE